MAIRTEQAQVLEPIVGVIAIHVIEFERYRSAAPSSDTARRAGVVQKTRRHEALPQLRGLRPSPGDEHLVERPRRHDRDGEPTPPRGASKVGGVEPQASNGIVHRPIVPACGTQAEGANDRPHARCGSDSRSQRVVGPLRLPARHARSTGWRRKKRGAGDCSRPRVRIRTRAGNGTRTRDPNLGKVVLYQLSYSRATSEV